MKKIYMLPLLLVTGLAFFAYQKADGRQMCERPSINEAYEKSDLVIIGKVIKQKPVQTSRIIKLENGSTREDVISEQESIFLTQDVIKSIEKIEGKRISLRQSYNSWENYFEEQNYYIVFAKKISNKNGDYYKSFKCDGTQKIPNGFFEVQRTINLLGLLKENK